MLKLSRLCAIHCCLAMLVFAGPTPAADTAPTNLFPLMLQATGWVHNDVLEDGRKRLGGG